MGVPVQMAVRYGGISVYRLIFRSIIAATSSSADIIVSGSMSNKNSCIGI